MKDKTGERRPNPQKKRIPSASEILSVKMTPPMEEEVYIFFRSNTISLFPSLSLIFLIKFGFQSIIRRKKSGFLKNANEKRKNFINKISIRTFKKFVISNSWIIEFLKN